MITPAITREAARRILTALVLAETRRTRGADFVPACGGTAAWVDDLAFGEAGIGLDSLDIVHAAAAINEMFDLADVPSGEAPPRTVGAWLDAIARAQQGGSDRLTVLTSGSTGAPKPCTHAVADLLEEVEHFASGLADRTRVLAMVPANHIYGLIWTALLPERLGIPVSAAAIGAMPPLQTGDLIVAVPDQWRALLRSGHRWPDGIIGISAGAPLDDVLAADLLATGLARLIDVYGASEIGGIAARDAPHGAYTLLPRWRWPEAVDGAVTHLLDQSGCSVPQADRLVRNPDGSFVLAGRCDGAVQVAGINVWPGHVASVLRRCTGVADAVVRPGHAGRLKAFIVPRASSETDALHKQLEIHVRAALSIAERPTSYRFGSAVPLNSLGKAMDWS